MTLPYIFRQRAMRMAAAGALGVLLLGGCADKDAQKKSYDPVEITAETSCELDGMTLADYPGPKAQIHYADQDKPAFFCDTIELFSMLLADEQVRPTRAIFVQDMGQADWDSPKGHWISAKTAFYVVGSSRQGSMGKTLASFAQKADAEKFAKEFGGQVYSFDQIKPDMVDLRGGALHDSSM